MAIITSFGTIVVGGYDLYDPQDPRAIAARALQAERDGIRTRAAESRARPGAKRIHATPESRKQRHAAYSARQKARRLKLIGELARRKRGAWL